MEVAIYAREPHNRWIEAEGFQYAASAVAAASGADVLSVHIGLRRLASVTGAYSNAGTVDARCSRSMTHGAVLINYHWGDVVDADASPKRCNPARSRTRRMI